MAASSAAVLGTISALAEVAYFGRETTRTAPWMQIFGPERAALVDGEALHALTEWREGHVCDLRHAEAEHFSGC